MGTASSVICLKRQKMAHQKILKFDNWSFWIRICDQGYTDCVPRIICSFLTINLSIPRYA